MSLSRNQLSTGNLKAKVSETDDDLSSAEAQSTKLTGQSMNRFDRFRHVPPIGDETLPRSSRQVDASRRVLRKRLHESDDTKTEATVSQPPKSSKRQRRQSSRYAPPSKYSHLSELIDVIEPNLICLFVGTNPGIRTATAGHAYAHPSNRFWKLLHSSGCTDVRLRPEQDVDLPRLYSMGNTNIVSRPSKDAAELSKAEMAAGTPILEQKVNKYKPEAVCIVGKGIWEAVWRWKYKREIRKDEFRYGWQDETERMGRSEDDSAWPGAKVFVATSTSGLAASLTPAAKEAIWKPFGDWVKMRREERSTESRASQRKHQVANEIT